VLRGGDIIQVAPSEPDFNQSVVVRSKSDDLKGLQGRRSALRRLDRSPHSRSGTLLEPQTSRDVNILQMGGFHEGGCGVGARAIDGAVFRRPQFSQEKRRFSRIGGAKDVRAWEAVSDFKGSSSQVLRRGRIAICCPIDKSPVRGHEVAMSNDALISARSANRLGLTDQDLRARDISTSARRLCTEPFVPESTTQ